MKEQKASWHSSSLSSQRNRICLNGSRDSSNRHFLKCAKWMEKRATEIYQPQLFWLKWDVLFPELFSDFMTQHIFWWFFLSPVGFGSRGWAVRGLSHPSPTHIRIGYNHYRCTFPFFRYGASWVCFATNFNTIVEARLMFKWLLKICSPREYHTFTPSHGYPGQKYNENSEVVNIFYFSN